MKEQTLRGALAFLVLLSASCKDSLSPAEGPEIASFTASQSSLDMAQGSSQSVLFLISRNELFDGIVDLEIENLPEGVTAVFGPTTLVPGAEQSLLTVTVLPSAEPGTYSIKCYASGLHVETKSVEIVLVVTVPGLTISSVESASVEQGKTTIVPVSIARTGGYAGSVTLQVMGLPPGISSTFEPTVLQVGTTNAFLTLNASMVVQTGNVPIVVRANAIGLLPVESEIDLLVTPGPPVLLVSTAGVNLVQGEMETADITIKRGGDYSGTVTLTIEGATPAGAVFEITPASSTGSDFQVSVTTAANTPVGATSLTLRAKGAGVVDAIAPFLLVVREPPGIRIALGAPELIINRGESGSTTYSYTRHGGYSGTVTVTVDGAPSGLTHNFPPAFPSGPSTTGGVTIGVASSVPPGTYKLLVRGAGAAVEAESTLTVVVQ